MTSRTSITHAYCDDIGEHFNFSYESISSMGFDLHLSLDVTEDGYIYKREFNLLVLSNYDAELRSKKIARKILGKNFIKSNGTIAIDKKDGQIYWATLNEEDAQNLFSFGSFKNEKGEKLFLLVPENFISRIPELKKKRSFRFSIESEALMDFISRDIGYNTLRNYLQISLFFNKETIKV